MKHVTITTINRKKIHLHDSANKDQNHLSNAFLWKTLLYILFILRVHFQKL
jgi:hypothetical protein